mmetsp:Transcript_4031/g.8782  ORF Transcript_4031/g.8782 Transcript_4031/m.8782 type:complete len:95 (+) Transcript_4031:181-465(+)
MDAILFAVEMHWIVEKEQSPFQINSQHDPHSQNECRTANGNEALTEFPKLRKLSWCNKTIACTSSHPRTMRNLALSDDDKSTHSTINQRLGNGN